MKFRYRFVLIIFIFYIWFDVVLFEIWFKKFFFSINTLIIFLFLIFLIFINNSFRSEANLTLKKEETRK